MFHWFLLRNYINKAFRIMFIKYNSFFKVNTTKRQNSKPHLKFTLKLSVFAFLVIHHLPPFSLPFLFKWRGYKESTDATGLKRKRSQGTVIVVLFLHLVIFLAYSIQLYLEHSVVFTAQILLVCKAQECICCAVLFSVNYKWCKHYK